MVRQVTKARFLVRNSQRRIPTDTNHGTLMPETSALTRRTEVVATHVLFVEHLTKLSSCRQRDQDFVSTSSAQSPQLSTTSNPESETRFLDHDHNRIITLVTVVMLYIPAFSPMLPLLVISVCLLVVNVYLVLNRDSSSSRDKTGKQKKKKDEEEKNRVGIERSHQRRDCLPFPPTS